MCVQFEETKIISKFISIDCSVSVTRSVLKVLIKSIGISYHREMFIYFPCPSFSVVWLCQFNNKVRFWFLFLVFNPVSVSFTP
jgi:hypothetical protein